MPNTANQIFKTGRLMSGSRFKIDVFYEYFICSRFNVTQYVPNNNKYFVNILRHPVVCSKLISRIYKWFYVILFFVQNIVSDISIILYYIRLLILYEYDLYKQTF